MHDTASSNLNRETAREGTATLLPKPESMQAGKTTFAAMAAKQPSLLMRLMRSIARLFGRGNPVMKAAPVQSGDTPEERAATAIAAGAQPPMAFKGDTANTLVTPMGAYAGKPALQAIRKRAEQQFKSFDITTATMN